MNDNDLMTLGSGPAILSEPPEPEDESARKRDVSASDGLRGNARPAGTGLRSVDLTGRERHLRAAMTAMGGIATRFARAARRTLPFLVWRKSRLVPQSVSIASVPAAATGPGLHAFYEEESSSAWACVSLNDVSLGLILEGALGAQKSGGRFTFGRELTLAQKALATRLVRSLGEDLLESMRQEINIELALANIHATPTEAIESIQRADGLSVDCYVDGVDGAMISIAVQATALESAVQKQDEEEPQHGDPRMYQIVQEVPVQVIAELGRVTLGLREVLELKVGQTLRLSSAIDDPVRVEIAGLKKFVGVPVVSRGQLAVEVKGRHGD